MTASKALRISSGAAVLVLGIAVEAPALAQVVNPTSPTELVDLTTTDAFKLSLREHQFVFAAMHYAVATESGATETPYTDAITTWFLDSLLSTRTHQMFASEVRAANAKNPVDLYLLLGQSNMSGLTESPGWNGPDEEIRTLLQAVTPGRTVVTLNCSKPQTQMSWWQPSVAYGLLQECIDSARGVRNALGTRATIRGFFTYQGESDASLEQTHPGEYASTWAAKYTNMIDALRDQFGDAPAVHAQLAVNGKTDPTFLAAWDAVKAAQASVVLDYSAMITTDDLRIHDTVHLDDCSQACAGERFASAMLGLQGRPLPGSTYCASLPTCWATL